MKEPKTFSFFLKVRKYELDSFGHVNNAVYFHYLETAIDEAMSSLGYTVPRLKELGIIILVKELNIKFKHPALLGDELEVRSYVSEARRVRGTWHQQIINRKTSKVLVEAYNTGVFLDLEGKPTKIPQEIVEALLPYTKQG
ncbi:MAG TPA: thioesterase family protein [Candidatus Limnocylindrales bacterium]|nr:thioesterase family protein [Candidatus Limnocylindrales bacterium]